MRLQRVLADAGVAARRACETLIEEGHVRVNGIVVTRLPVFVDPENDRIEVDGRLVRRPSRKLVVMFNKPERVLVTSVDEPGADRRTITQYIDHPAATRLFPVGRLDYDSTGLVLLTNDGELANRLTHPRYGITKRYHAIVRGTVDDERLAEIARQLAMAIRRSLRDDPGRRASRAAKIDLERRERGAEGTDASVEVRVFKREPTRTTLELDMREAQNRVIRETLRIIGHPVKKLTRVAIGALELKGLAVGQWRELTREEIQTLRGITRPGRGGKGRARQDSRGSSRTKPKPTSPLADPSRSTPGSQASSTSSSQPAAASPARPPRRDTPEETVYVDMSPAKSKPRTLLPKGSSGPKKPAGASPTRPIRSNG